MKEGRIRTIAQGSPEKDAIHEVSASSTASRSRPFSIEDVKESVPSAMNVKAARMISRSNRLIKVAMTRELLPKMKGQQKTALAAVLVNKLRLPRKKTPKR